MKKKLYYLFVLVVLFASCEKTGKEPFEKAIQEVYGSKVECVDLVYKDMYSYNYEMDFNDKNRMIKSFLSLAYKVDSIMQHDYQSVRPFPNYVSLQASWLLDNCDPMTSGNWYADDDTWDISVDIRIDLEECKKGRNSMSLSYTKLRKKR